MTQFLDRMLHRTSATNTEPSVKPQFTPEMIPENFTMPQALPKAARQSLSANNEFPRNSDQQQTQISKNHKPESNMNQQYVQIKSDKSAVAQANEDNPHVLSTTAQTENVKPVAGNSQQSKVLIKTNLEQNLHQPFPQLGLDDRKTAQAFEDTPHELLNTLQNENSKVSTRECEKASDDVEPAVRRENIKPPRQVNKENLHVKEEYLANDKRPINSEIEFASRLTISSLADDNSEQTTISNIGESSEKKSFEVFVGRKEMPENREDADSIVDENDKVTVKPGTKSNEKSAVDSNSLTEQENTGVSSRASVNTQKTTVSENAKVLRAPEPSRLEEVQIRPVLSKESQITSTTGRRPMSRAREAKAYFGEESAEPTVTISIGRIEVRALIPEKPSEAKVKPTLSLGEYLKRRQEGTL
jgi:hypothetical protein